MMGGVCANDIDESTIGDSNSTDIQQDGMPQEDLANLNVAVNYQYSEDNGKINPTIMVNNKHIVSKEYNSSSNYYNVVINSTNADKLNISIYAPGYLTQYKIITPVGNSVLPNVTFDMKASESYKLGHEVTVQADKYLDFDNADDVLAITTAGVAKYKGKTSEDAMEAIVNYGKVSYSNILMLRQSAVDPIDFAFIVKKGNELKAVVFQNGSTKYSYLGTISENMTKSHGINITKRL